MKLIFFLFIIMSSTLALETDLEKAKKFIEKKKACRVAFSSVQSGNQVPEEVYCVFEGLGNKGTIREFTGCFFGRYNMNTDTYRPLFDAGAGMMARSQPNGPCTKRLVLDILTKYPSTEWLQFGKTTQPILPDMRQDDPSVRIIYDEWGVITPLVQQKGKKEKISKPKIKKFKNVDCNSGWRSDPDDEVYCSTPEEIVAQCKNVNLSEKGRQLRKMVYKTKTGNSLGKCLRE